MSIFERLEAEANDDFRLLEEFGPAYFGMDHLLELRQKAAERLAIFQRRQKLSIMVGASSTFWVFIAFLARGFNFFWIAVGAYAAAGLGFGGFLYLIYLQKKHFESLGELEYAQRIIEEELRRRVGKTPQKPRP